MRRVAIFRSELLRLSETFICNQAQALTTWEPVLVGFSEVMGGLQTPGLQRVIVPSTTNRFINGARFWLSRPIPQVVKLLKRLRIDLVHAHFGTDATEIWPSVKAAGLPMLVTLHGYDINIHREWWEAGHGGLRQGVYPQRLLNMAKNPTVNFIAVSRAIRERAIQYGIPAEKVTVAYIGIDTEQFKPAGLPLTQRKKRILFVGRMVEKKAPLLLVRAFADILKEVPNAELVMIGDGPLRTSTERFATASKIPVTFLGALNSTEILAQLHDSRIFCLPSITAKNGDAEGFGLVLLEAQACGVPVVSSALGGASEGLLSGRTGFQCAENQLTELTDAILKLLKDDRLANNFSIQAVEFTKQNFNLKLCTELLEWIYDNSSSPPTARASRP